MSRPLLLALSCVISLAPSAACKRATNSASAPVAASASAAVADGGDETAQADHPPPPPGVDGEQMTAELTKRQDEANAKLRAPCPGYYDAVLAAKQRDETDFSHVLDGVDPKPGGTPAQIAACKTEWKKRTADMTADILQDEGQGAVKIMAIRINGDRKLCPVAKPVPPSLDQLAPAYTPTDADRSDPGWDCFKVFWKKPIHFQLEGRAAPGGAYDTFARRKDGNAILEYSVHVTKNGDGYSFGDVKTVRKPLH
jgi:hypothetical protein